MNGHRTRATLFLRLSLLGWLAACGADAPANSPSPSAQPSEAGGLVDRTFLLQSVEGYTLVPGTVARLSFTATTVRLYAGCNTIAGSYTLGAGVLASSQLSTTNIGCSAAQHVQDDWLARFLSQNPKVVLVDNDLTLSTPTASLRWLDREIADPDRDLVGPTWSIDSFISPLSTASYLQVPKPTLALSPGGGLKVVTPCNTGYGTFRVQAGELTLRDVSYTERACVSADAAKVEQLVQEVLQDGTFTWTIEANRLTLRHGDVGVIAQTP